MSSDSPPSDATRTGGSRGRPFWRHVSGAVDRFDELLVFVAVPLFASVFEIENVRRTLEPAPGGFSISFEFLFPSPLLDLWSFADPPDPPRSSHASGSDPFGGPPSGEPIGGTRTGPGGDAVDVDLPIPVEAGFASELGVGLVAVVVLLLVGYAAIFATVYAIYVGGIHRRLRGEPVAAGDCVHAYAGRFFAYMLVVFGAVLALVPFALLSPAILLLAIPAFLVLAYLFYAVPFLFVVADAPFLEAFGRSYRLAVRGGSYLTFALWHLGVTVVASLVLSLVVSSSGPLPLLFGLALACPLSLILTAATVSFLDELVDDGRVDRSGPASYSTD